MALCSLGKIKVTLKVGRCAATPFNIAREIRKFLERGQIVIINCYLREALHQPKRILHEALS